MTPGATGALTQASGTSVLVSTVATPDVTVAGGTLQLAGNQRLAGTTTLTMRGGTFALNGFAQALATLSGTGIALLSREAAGGTLTVGAGRFDGSIVDGGTAPGSLVKAGAGTLVLTGTDILRRWYDGCRRYPYVPGHEIVGRVTRVGSEVRDFKPGDLAAVGCMVDSCGSCTACREGLEQYCEPGFTGTYNGPEQGTGATTYGGYASHIVVDRHFVLHVPEGLDLAGVAPLLCAGITTDSPLRRWGAGPGKKVGIVGLGGLGHMGVKLAHAMGAEVVLFTTSPGKEADARRLGADAVVLSKDAGQMAEHAESFDLIVDTVAARHDINAYLGLSKRDCTLVQVGAPEKPLEVNVFSVIWRRRNFSGSLIGGIAETQEMLDFCGKHGITADIKLIPMAEVEAAYARMLESDVKHRFVIDMATLQQAA